ncbi:hypothetical protein ASS64_07135 [Erythrobacter sp. AP23]|nr:hypothetical protein ASS64_07135 [Erythrobacter sp. AP23]
MSVLGILQGSWLYTACSQRSKAKGHSPRTHPFSGEYALNPPAGAVGSGKCLWKLRNTFRQLPLQPVEKLVNRSGSASLIDDKQGLGSLPGRSQEPFTGFLA